MKDFSVIVRAGKHFFPMLLFFTLSCMGQSVVESVAAASEWPLGLPEEYTMAYINITYRLKNGSLVSDKSQLRKNSGRFGKGGKIAAASGVVVHVKSIRNGTIHHYGCDPIINDVPEGDWIALIKRGMCDFDMKLEHAYAKKAVAMVVYDREDSDTLEDMKLSAYTIPGIFTFKSRGERIANLTDAGARVEMHITVGEVCSRPYTGINRTGMLDMTGSVDGYQCVDKNTSVLFVSISFIVLMVISLAWLVFYYIQRFRYLHAKDRLAQRLCNAAKKALAKIPTRSVKLTDKEIIGEAECCAVCIDFYKAGDMLRTLPCRHEFHKCCVDPWLLEHRTCPMCKMDILKHYGYIFTGSQESILHLDLEDGGLNSSDSRDTDTPTGEETQIHTHHEHHRIHHHPTDSFSISSPTDETFSSIPDDQPDYQYTDEMTRKSSLISLTVTASPDGCITTTATTTTPTLSPQCTTFPSTGAGDCLISTFTSGNGSMGSVGGGGSNNKGNATPTALLKATIASPNDSTIITSLYQEASDEHPMCQRKESSSSRKDIESQSKSQSSPSPSPLPHRLQTQAIDKVSHQEVSSATPPASQCGGKDNLKEEISCEGSEQSPNTYTVSLQKSQQNQQSSQLSEKSDNVPCASNLAISE